MNILVPYPWLLEHLYTDVQPEEFQRLLSLSGPSVERIHTSGADAVLDVEVTTNRMDSASIRGIAREAAVILPQNGKHATLKEIQSYLPKPEEITHDASSFPIKIEVDHTLCSRVTCVILNVKIKTSPEWLSTRLEQVGVRSLNNLIDVTNYVMTEIGHPTHAFDADRLGDTMIIRQSKPGEKLTTLDNKTHTLKGGDIVIDNGKGELTDLIGIMGTANSVVTNDTKRILFFIEHSDPKKIRQTSMGLAIRTNAAQLNEKMLDANLVMDALLRGIQLYKEVAEASVETPILDVYPNPVKPITVTLPLAKTETYLGVDIPVETQTKILEGLGCTVKPVKDSLEVEVPTLRPDIEIPVDLIEEIARIYGYHNLPSRLMDTPIPTDYPADTDFTREHKIKEFLATLGWQEIYTYSTVSKAVAEQSGYTLDKHLPIQNPLNDDHVYLRRSLIPSHMEILDNNRHRKSLSVFELANTYEPQATDLPVEHLKLTLTTTQSVRELRGAMDAVFTKLHIPLETVHIEQTNPHWAPVHIGKEQVGTLYLCQENRHAVELEWTRLLHASRRNPTYHPISPFTAIGEDITFTIPKDVKLGELVKTVKAVSPVIVKVELKDIYKQNATLSLEFHLNNKQISATDVEPIRKLVKEKVAAAHGASVVGAV